MADAEAPPDVAHMIHIDLCLPGSALASADAPAVQQPKSGGQGKRHAPSVTASRDGKPRSEQQLPGELRSRKRQTA